MSKLSSSSQHSFSAGASMASESRPIRMLFFPLMAPGHMLPMLDMAKLFASRGVDAFILTTPANVPAVEFSISNHPSIQLLSVALPSLAHIGIPDGCENVSSLPAPEFEAQFLTALSALRHPFAKLLEDLLPDCVVSDMFLPWTCDAASVLGIPRLVFHGWNFFSTCATSSLQHHKTLDSLPADAASFIVPGLPHRIEMLVTQMPNYEKSDPLFVEIFRKMNEAEVKTYGSVINSFYELEPEYADYYRNVVGKRAWHIGPLLLSTKKTVEQSSGGSKGHDDTYVNWLNTKPPGSVVYVCFGSISFFSSAELREIALGLEASSHKFIWVVRDDHGKEWLPEGYETRIAGRGLIIRGWAPQILILNHRAVGGFLTHCGWNSCLEGVSAGLPLITWPLSADQFYNEKLIVDVLKVGVAIGSKKYAMKPEERPVVVAAKIGSAVDRVMGGGEEAEERRRKARELAEAAKRAVEEGGSSYMDVGNLIKELMAMRNACAL